MKNSISPMMDHYLKIKEKHKDCIIFYRLGDFYEMFFDDAIAAAAAASSTMRWKMVILEE